MRYIRTGIVSFGPEIQSDIIIWYREKGMNRHFFSRDPMIILKFPREILYPAFIGSPVKIKNRNDSKISFFVSLISLFLID